MAGKSATSPSSAGVCGPLQTTACTQLPRTRSGGPAQTRPDRSPRLNTYYLLHPLTALHRHAIGQLKAWIQTGRPLEQAPEPPKSISTGARGNERQASELTERELQIAELMAQGLTNKEIARSISLNQRAVEFHVGKLMEK